MNKTATIAAINNGSSNLKFSLFTVTDPPRQLINGKITVIGARANLHIARAGGEEISSSEAGIDSIEKASNLVVDWLKQEEDKCDITGIGHRVVQGGLLFSEPEHINTDFLQALKKMEPLAPLHLPASISIMHLFLKAFPAIPQLACFDTHFHRNMHFEAKHIALPRSLWKKGIIRYGFHGLSCEYIMQRLKQDDSSIVEKKIIIAHLGSGCSLTAVKHGAGIDTTMGFSPTGGLIMNSRPGDIDPGIVTYLLKEEKMDAAGLTQLFNKQSGLKAISESDRAMEQLVEDEETDPRARQAIDMFCYQVKKHIGALAIPLGGIDILVFTGGIGENEPVIRERICEGLDFLGVTIDKEANRQSVKEIGVKNSKVSVLVIETNEEFIIAGELYRFLQK